MSKIDLAYDDMANRKRLGELSQMFNVSSIDIDKALNFQYGLDRDEDLTTYTNEEVEDALDYFFDKGLYADWV